MFRVFALAFAVALLSAGPSCAREWERPGEMRVIFSGDRDSIEVGRQQGKLKRLKLLVPFAHNR